MEGRVYLDMDESIFEKEKKKAKERAREEFGSDNTRSLFWDLNFSINELDYNESEITATGSVESGSFNLGYLTVVIPLDIDTIVKVIEDYVKRMNKVKNVLESVK